MCYEDIASELLKTRAEFLHVQALQEMSKMLKGELFVLNYLATHEQQTHPNKISKEMAVSTARIAVLLNRLEEKGFITRTDDPEDNRQVIVRLTEKGAENIAQCRKETLSHVTEMLEHLGPDDARELLRIEKKIVQFYCK